MDQDCTFMSPLMNYLLKKSDIKIRTVVPYKHQSLQAKHRIKSLSQILTKHLTKLGQRWPNIISYFCLHMFNTPNVGNYGPYELMFGREPRSLLHLESTPYIKVSGNFKEYCV